MKRVLLVLVVAWWAGLAPSRAAAAASRVVLLRSGGTDALPRQAETLLAAELRASGFEVVQRERAPHRELRDDIEDAATALRPIAVLALAATTGASAEIWLSDRVTGKLVIRRIDGGPSDGDPAAALALRAVELLRGSLLEITVEAPPAAPAAAPRAAPPADVARFVATRTAGHRAYFVEGFGVGLGGVVLGSPALGATYAPALRLSYGGRRFGVRLSLMGPGSEADAAVRDGEDLLGTAHVRQELGLVEGVVAFRPESALQPFVSLGAGVHRVRVEGTGAAPLFPGRTGNSLGLALAGGVGTVVRLGDRAALVLEAQLVATLPSTRVSVADQQATRVGPITALGAIGVATAF